MKLLKTDNPYLSKEQWTKLAVAFSIMIIVLYSVAMIFSLCGNTYFIMNYQNDQMDRIEAWTRERNLIALIQELFMTLETTIVLWFILRKRPKWYYILVAYALPLIVAYSMGYMPSILQTGITIGLCLIIPVVEQLKDNHKSEYHVKFSWKQYGKQMLKLLVAIGVTLILQAMITVIKGGYFDGKNHILSLSGFFIYSLEYDIALAVILFTISLLINREKGDSSSWTYLAHGGSSQTSKMKSQKSSEMMKNLTKTQRNRLRLLYAKVYLFQISAFLLVMVLPFLVGKVFEFLVMYFAFCVARYILGFNYSLHYKKESLCITVGVIVFGILTLAVPFFYVDMILALSIGIGLAVLLHLSYKYKSFYLFNKIAKPDKFAVLYVFFDGDLDGVKVKNYCKMKGLDQLQTSLIYEFTQGNKISYLAWKHNYSQRMTIYKLDEAIDKLLD